MLQGALDPRAVNRAVSKREPVCVRLNEADRGRCLCRARRLDELPAAVNTERAPVRPNRVGKQAHFVAQAAADVERAVATVGIRAPRSTPVSESWKFSRRNRGRRQIQRPPLWCRRLGTPSSGRATPTEADNRWRRDRSSLCVLSGLSHRAAGDGEAVAQDLRQEPLLTFPAYPQPCVRLCPCWGPPILRRAERLAVGCLRG